MLQYPRVLLLFSDDLQAVRLEGLIEDYVHLTRARNLDELSELLATCCFNAVICAWSYYGGNWRNTLLEALRFQPDLPVLVLSPTGGEREWVEVLEAGAFDLLVPPYNKETMRAVLEQAIASHGARTLQRTAR